MDHELGLDEDEESQHLLSAKKRRIPVRELFATVWRNLCRPTRYWIFHAVKYLAVAWGLIAVITPLFMPSYANPPSHYGQLSQGCYGPPFLAGCANPNNETVFIAAILHDKDGKLARGKWGQRVTDLIYMLGPKNVFLSIYENDSGDEGRKALEDFKEQVPCRNHIVIDDHVSLAEFPNVTMPDGSQRVKRVAYLSELRNRALRPLDTFDYQAQQAGVVAFDKVLFLNDIAFYPIDAAHLLFNTNQGADGRADYVAACALDWFDPFSIYDIYALRDAEGHANYQVIYPFFGRDILPFWERLHVLSQKDAVRVKSCWGGMMAMQAKYVQNLDRELPTPDFQAIAAHVIDPDKPRNVTSPVRFRHEPEVYYDACECCLFSADLTQAARQDGDVDTAETGIYVNPYVRVAYSTGVLWWLPIVKRAERLLVVAYDIATFYIPQAENPYRTVEEGQTFQEEIWDNDTDKWQLVNRTGRSGLFCGIRDMQILRRENDTHTHEANWVNTKMPPGQNLSF
ncbi:glycosyltransferase family 69 protein, partial [Diplogelasinospora grovesii]